MTFSLLYTDELRGFIKSKVIASLWIGLPLLAMVIRWVQPDADGMPLLTFVAIIVAGIGGTIASVLLSTSITSERNKHVYDLFLARPVKRRSLLIAKYFAALSAVLVAVLLSLLLGAAVESISGNGAVVSSVKANLESLLVSVTGIAVACSIGVLFGVLLNSVAVSAILSAYLGNQLSGLIILPIALIPSLNLVIYCLAIMIVVPAVVLTVATAVFNRKNL